MNIDAKSPQGEGFAIINAVKTYLRVAKRLDEWPAAQKRMLESNYADLCAVAEEVTNGGIRIVNR